MNRKTRCIDLDQVSYIDAWDMQRTLFNRILEEKKTNHSLPKNEQSPTDNYLLVCEHPHVFTLGKNGNKENLLIPRKELSNLNATFHHVERGGDITYHGPGQIVLYPVIDMENFFTDIHRYMRLLEEAVIKTLSHYNIMAGRIKGATGVWVNAETKEEAKKICALGVKTSRWVTLHGLALNVNVTLDYFRYIVPCGIKNKSVTSMEKELGSKQEMKEVKRLLIACIATLFGMEIVE